MVNPQMVMYEEEFNQIQAIVVRLVKEANARVVFVIDKNGQEIAKAGETDQLDTTSLASLTAGNIAATGGMAKLLRENEFTTQFHEGERANIHIQIVGNRAASDDTCSSQKPYKVHENYSCHSGAALAATTPLSVVESGRESGPEQQGQQRRKLAGASIRTGHCD